MPTVPESEPDRWSDGTDHHPQSVALMRYLAEIDFKHYGDSFCWKMGGDGDNGETLMYEMDSYFEQEDAEKEEQMQGLWDSGHNCVWCGESGRCRCNHAITNNKLLEAARHILEGLLTDEAHHKQDSLERAAKALGADTTVMRRVHRYEPGIPA